MAKPENTPYQILADFSKLNTEDYIVTHTGPVGIDNSYIRAGNLKKAMAHKFGRGQNIGFSVPEEAYISFGFSNAESLLRQCRAEAKKQFKKGQRPTFFMRKLTMSEFMAHPEFKKWKTSNEKIRTLYKKYLIMDDLRDGGFQK